MTGQKKDPVESAAEAVADAQARWLKAGEAYGAAETKLRDAEQALLEAQQANPPQT